MRRSFAMYRFAAAEPFTSLILRELDDARRGADRFARRFDAIARRFDALLRRFRGLDERIPRPMSTSCAAGV